MDKDIAVQNWWLGFNSWDPYKNGRRESISQSCPQISTPVQWHVCMLLYAHYSPYYTDMHYRKIKEDLPTNEPNKTTIIPPWVVERMAQKSKDFSQFTLKLWSSGVIKIPRWIEISMFSNKITDFLISCRSVLYKGIQTKSQWPGAKARCTDCSWRPRRTWVAVGWPQI